MNKEKQLLQAAAENNSAVLQQMLDAGVSPDIQTDEGHTALIFAAIHGHHDCVALLLQNKCDVNIENIHGATALGYASFKGFVDIVKLLIQNGATIDQQARDGNTPLMAAIRTEQHEVIKLLIESNAHCELENSEHLTAFTMSIAMNNLAAASLMLEKGIECKAVQQALYAGVMQKDLHFITLLFANVGAIDKDFVSNALIGASVGGSLVIADYLLRQGASVHYKTADNLTAFGAACYQGHYDIATLLLEHDADYNAINPGGNTPIMWAASIGHVEIVKLLLAQDAINIAHKNDSNKDVFDAAVYNGNVAILKLLLASYTASNKNLLLNGAAYGGHIDIINFFLEDGVDVNAQDEQGYTPLILAAAKGYVAIVELLLKNQANIHHEDSTGNTALSHANSQGKTDIVAILLNNGAVFKDKVV